MFQISSKSDEGENLFIDINEFQLLTLIHICLKERRNKNIGVILARIYIETGREAKQKLREMGLEPECIYDNYNRYKKIFG